MMQHSVRSRTLVLRPAAAILALACADQGAAAPVLPAGLAEAIDAGAVPVLAPPLDPDAPLPTLQRLPGYIPDYTAIETGAGPNPRALSNALSVPGNARTDAAPLSNLAVAFFQFVASHEIAHSPTGDVSANIPVNAVDMPGEATFTGDIAMSRSLSRPDSDGTLQQFNSVTSAFDGSVVYGSTAEREAMLRDTGTPYLLTDPTTGGLPLFEVEVPGMGTMKRPMAGDGRADENPTLLALHELFLREHNRLAAEIGQACPTCSADEVYDAAKYLVAKTQEKIFYDELMPLFVGTAPGQLSTVLTDNGIDPALLDTVDRAVNTFTAAAGRVGHTQVPDTILLDAFGSAAREVPLAECFFDRGCLGGASLAEILHGAAQQDAEAIDTVVTPALRNTQRLGFGTVPDTNIDLYATNMNRGRDHGLLDFFQLRKLLGFDDDLQTIDDALAILPQSVFDALAQDPLFER